MAADRHQDDMQPSHCNGPRPNLRELVERAQDQSSAWLNAIESNHLDRQHVQRLRDLTERLLAGDVIPLAAMEQVRKQLCECCKRVNAGKGYGGCTGRALGHCPILIALVVE